VRVFVWCVFVSERVVCVVCVCMHSESTGERVNVCMCGCARVAGGWVDGCKLTS